MSHHHYNYSSQYLRKMYRDTHSPFYPELKICGILGVHCLGINRETQEEEWHCNCRNCKEKINPMDVVYTLEALLEHLKIDAYRCPICEVFIVYNKDATNDHIQTNHPYLYQEEVITYLPNYYNNTFNKLYEQPCFQYINHHRRLNRQYHLSEFLKTKRYDKELEKSMRTAPAIVAPAQIAPASVSEVVAPALALAPVSEVVAPAKVVTELVSPSSVRKLVLSQLSYKIFNETFDADTLNADAQIADALIADALIADTSIADAPIADAPIADAPIADAPITSEVPVTSDVDTDAIAMQMHSRKRIAD